MPLFEHTSHPHVPQNSNDTHKAEQSSFSQRVAVAITRATGTMFCAYLFACLALLGFPLLVMGYPRDWTLPDSPLIQEKQRNPGKKQALSPRKPLILKNASMPSETL